MLLHAYKSLAEALAHGGIAHSVRVVLDWVDAEVFEDDEDAALDRLSHVHGILVPGGFGERGTPGKIEAVRFARERRVPFLGICFGMQMAVIEAARNLADMPGASSTEFGPTATPVVGLLTEWLRGNELERRAADGALGGTMRLGAYPAKLTEGSLAGDHHVVGTGTIDAEGDVGPIGGIRQKMIGASQAGADLFLAPVENCDEVRGHTPDGLPVVAVDTLDEAEEALAVLADDGDLSALPSCGDAQD